MPDAMHGPMLQLRGRTTVISVADVPEKEFVNGMPSASVLWQAETIFLQRQAEFFPAHEVIYWEARHQSPDGPLLSQFRVLLPAQED